MALNSSRDGAATGFLGRRKKNCKKKVIFGVFFFFFISVSFSHSIASVLWPESLQENFRTFEISSHCPKMINVYTVIKRTRWYYHKFQWETLRDWGCKTTSKKTNCSVWQEHDTADCFLVGFCRALWGFGLIALASFSRSEDSINLKCCPHKRFFKSLLSPEPQSPKCVAGQWILDLWELQGEDPKHQICCCLEETDSNCPWTHAILLCVTGVQPHCSHLLPGVIMFFLHVCAINI